jgi:adenosylcobyric acid synthase
VRAQHDAGATIVGVCGGYQMLGETIADPGAVESIGGVAGGLGLLPVRTVLAAEKRTAWCGRRRPAARRARPTRSTWA